jgi:hypothetical protein
MTIITLPKTSIRSEVKVEVQIGAEQAANLALLDGVPGRLAQLRRAMDIINNSGNSNWSPDSLIQAVQMSRRIEMNPSSALQEFRNFWAAQAGIRNDVGVLDLIPSTMDRALTYINAPGKAAAAAAK